MTIDVETAVRTGAAVSRLGSGFMLDMETYRVGGEHGFNGIDFYFGGRAGVLGDVDADTVTAALVFFHPETVRASWTASGSVMPRNEAASLFASCASTWSVAHLDGDLEWQELADLAGGVVASASVAAAPLFAGWRQVDVPDNPVAAALRQMNALRELRMARHGAAVVAVGLDPADAVRHHSPAMVGLFGWDAAEVPPGTAELWQEAEALTNRATAHDYAVFDEGAAIRFVELCAAADAAIRP